MTVVAPPLVRQTPPAQEREALFTGAAARQRLRSFRTWLAATRGHGVWIASWSVIGWVGTLLAPFLSDHPFLVMMLAPRALFVALAVDSVNIVTFVLLGTLRLGVTDASYFIVGRRIPRRERKCRVGPTAALWRRMSAVIVRLADAMFRWLASHGFRAGAVLFLRPNAKYLAVAGAYGVPAAVAGFASVLGTLVYLTCFYLGIGMLL